MSLFKILGKAIPVNFAKQVTAEMLLPEVYAQLNGQEKMVLDLGCGNGRSIDVFKRLDAKCKWHGLDIESSPEVSERNRNDGDFYTYDGVNIPFPDNHFDVIWSIQVFEHVRFPDALLKEVKRVLKPSGAFVGSVSYLEPYHSYSIWNYTPYGWHRLVTENGLKLIELRSGIDGVALIQRSYLGKRNELNSWFVESPLNREIIQNGTRENESIRQINYKMLSYAGHMVFWISKD